MHPQTFGIKQENLHDERVVIHKEMGITHADFLRLLPNALNSSHFVVKESEITFADSHRQIRISLSPETERVIASMRLPVTHVTLEFKGYTEAERDVFLIHFDNSYRRGGG